jgi:hypothetical protein
MTESNSQDGASICAAHRVEILTEACSAMLAGNDPSVSGAVCCDLLAKYISGHNPKLRADAMRLAFQMVKDLTPINAAMLARQRNLKDWATNTPEFEALALSPELPA